MANGIRNRASKRLFNYEYTQTKKDLDAGKITRDIGKTKKELLQIRDLYPMLISEAAIKAVY